MVIEQSSATKEHPPEESFGPKTRGNRDIQTIEQTNKRMVEILNTYVKRCELLCHSLSRELGAVNRRETKNR